MPGRWVYQMDSSAVETWKVTKLTVLHPASVSPAAGGVQCVGLVPQAKFLGSLAVL